jgi:hypothetical protein
VRGGENSRWLILGLLGAIAFTMVPARGGADLTLYRHMAQVALAGGYPYSDRYADFPPLKMAMIVLLERWRAWAIFRTIGFAALVATSLALAAGNRSWPRLAVLVLCFQPLVYHNWVDPFEDKWVYALLILGALVVARPPDWAREPGRTRAVAVALGLLAAYSGVTIVLLPLLLLELRRHRQSASRLIECAVIAFGIVLLGHLPFFPHWLSGYAHRFARQTFTDPVHESVFVLFKAAGAYTSALPSVLTLAGVVFGYVWWWRMRDWGTATLIAFWSTLALGPDASFDRILAATFPIFVILARRPLAIGAVLATLLVAGARVGSSDLGHGAGPVAILWTPVVLALGFWLARANVVSAEPEALGLSRTGS